MRDRQEGVRSADTKFVMPRRNRSSTAVVPSSGNVFRELGLPEAEEKQRKALPMAAIEPLSANEVLAARPLVPMA